jgi:hypothetical protein
MGNFKQIEVENREPCEERRQAHARHILSYDLDCSQIICIVRLGSHYCTFTKQNVQDVLEKWQKGFEGRISEERDWSEGDGGL